MSNLPACLWRRIWVLPHSGSCAMCRYAFVKMNYICFAAQIAELRIVMKWSAKRSDISPQRIGTCEVADFYLE